MSNITLFQDGSNLPTFLTSGADELAKQLAGGTDTRSISIKGGTFRLVVGGEEVAKKDERHMNVIIIKAQPKIGRAFYAEKYVEGKDSTPACWSADGVAPSPDSSRPQSSACINCPQNIKGSGENDSRACRFSQRLAVLLENDPQGEIYRITLPAKSIFGKAVGSKMPLQAYAKFIAGHGAPLGGIVTKMYFDTDEAVPVLRFIGSRALTQQEYEIAKAKAASPEADEAVEVSYPKPKEATPTVPLFAEEFEQAAPKQAPAAAEAAVAEPTVRKSKKTEAAPSPAQNVASILDEWGNDDEE